MSRLGSLVLASLCLVGTAFGDAAVKVGYVDVQKTLHTVEAGKTAKQELDKELAAKRKTLEKTQAALQAEAEQFEKKAAILNDSAKAAKQAELQKKFAEFQKTMAESQMELQKRERELTKPLLDEIREIVSAVSKEKGLQLVFEKNESALLYAEGGTDLTDAVVERFNSKHKGKAPAKKK